MIPGVLGISRPCKSKWETTKLPSSRTQAPTVPSMSILRECSICRWMSPFSPMFLVSPPMLATSSKGLVLFRLLERPACSLTTLPSLSGSSSCHVKMPQESLAPCRPTALLKPEASSSGELSVGLREDTPSKPPKRPSSSINLIWMNSLQALHSKQRLWVKSAPCSR